LVTLIPFWWQASYNYPPGSYQAGTTSSRNFGRDFTAGWSKGTNTAYQSAWK